MCRVDVAIFHTINENFELMTIHPIVAKMVLKSQIINLLVVIEDKSGKSPKSVRFILQAAWMFWKKFYPLVAETLQSEPVSQPTQKATPGASYNEWKEKELMSSDSSEAKQKNGSPLM